MLSETLDRELRQYKVGEKLRALRLRKKLGLVELGRHSGLSPALLSKIERGRLVPTLPTLMRIALVFSVGLEHFFTPTAQPMLAVIRKNERQRFPDRMGETSPSYYFESLDYAAVDRKFNTYFVEFQEIEPERARRHHHAGAEFLYVIRGRVIVNVGDVDHTLDTGDSIYFDSSVPHSYRRSGSRPCSAVVVTT